MINQFPYKWHLSGGYPMPGVKYHGNKVFGTFICGGGSTMGYKQAGYDHIGGIEIDKKIAEVYELNHKPKFLYLQDIREFLKRDDLPEELYNLDILDGSPPCSTFSMSGNREDDWGIQKTFREGQTQQTLDDLFFSFIALVDKLRPKVFSAENVKGLVYGNAKAYAKEIVAEFEKIGYNVQVFQLNAATMGVPQARERIFIIGHRNDLAFPKLQLSFNLPPITVGDVEKNVETIVGDPLSEAYKKWWVKCKPGKALSSVHPKGSFFNTWKLSKWSVCRTIASTKAGKFTHYSMPNSVNDDFLKLCGTFPMDYDFNGIDPQYIIGMSVPPVMVAQIAHQIKRQWLDYTA